MRSTVLHCGCFLAVTIGPATWECLRLQTRQQSLNPSPDGQLRSSSTHTRTRTRPSPPAPELRADEPTPRCSAPSCLRGELALCSFRGEQLNLLGFLRCSPPAVSRCETHPPPPRARDPERMWTAVLEAAVMYRYLRRAFGLLTAAILKNLYLDKCLVNFPPLTSAVLRAA